ncbi:tRNA 2-thiouridine(34) synthase MnmA [Candidatus Berkelbacteria bacterium]|nr:tRNA 2-thiouridine(34) synthase MnmA [Candidatus Berkelbacteria bacterium]
MTQPLRVFVMLSGGVDSSVAAARLVDSGYSVEGIFMRNWSEKRLSDTTAQLLRASCNNNEDVAYAHATAQFLKIPFREVNFEKEYWEHVIEPFFDGIAKGYTPNPDVWCNQYVKYGVFLEWALAQGADLVASGHYARIGRGIKNYELSIKEKNYNTYFLLHNTADVSLLRGIDSAKDQSYFLAHVPKEKLARALFPIGHLAKSQVRAEAFARGLPTATKKDSQGICFVGKIPLKEFLKERFTQKMGDVVLKDGTVIGKHMGAYFYTIGERIGLNYESSIMNYGDKEKTHNTYFMIHNTVYKGSDRQALYVTAKDIKGNILVVGEDDGSYPLWQKEFIADNWNFFESPQEKEVYDVEIRYHQIPRSRGKIIKIPKLKIENYKLQITLQEPVRAVTPGQTVVVSKGDKIIGSGIITDD